MHLSIRSAWCLNLQLFSHQLLHKVFWSIANRRETEKTVTIKIGQYWINFDLTFQCWFFDDWFLYMLRLYCCVSNELCSLLISPAGLPLFLSLSLLRNLALYYATSLCYTSLYFLVCCPLMSIFYLCPCLHLYQACLCKFAMTSCLPVSLHVLINKCSW